MRALLLLSSLIACSGDAPTPDDTDDVDILAQLDAAGPYRAGFRVSEVPTTDTFSGAPRGLRLALWYPTDADAGTDAAYLFDSKPAPGVLADAPPADGPFGLAVFSHGTSVYAEVSGALMAHLATHGWIVAAVDHVPDVIYDPGGRDNATYLQRPLDVSATLDHLLDGEEPGLAVDADRVWGVGHSFGGYTMVVLAGAVWDMDTLAPLCNGGASDAFCKGWDPAREDAFRAGAADERLSTVVLMNGGDHRRFGASGLASVDRDVLLITGSLDDQVPNDPVGDGYWRDLPDGEHVRVDMAHGDHTSLTDFAGTPSAPGAHPDGLDADRAHRIGRILLGAWARARVDGDEAAAALLSAPPFDEDLTLQAR